jgi:hypothetical protein
LILAGPSVRATVTPGTLVVEHVAGDGIQREVEGGEHRSTSSAPTATTVEVPTNHVAIVSHPDEVLQPIKTAAEAVPAAT